MRSPRHRREASPPAPVPFRAWLLFVALAIALVVHAAFAEEVAVPIGLQAELLAKVAAYDKNLAERAGDRVHVLIVTKNGSDDSQRAAAQMRVALGALDSISGLPHDEQLTPYGSAPALAALVREQHAAIVYLTPGLAGDVDAIRDAFDGLDVLTVAAVPDYVPRGVVLGFDLVSGKPKLLVHLTQARKQHVALKAEVLKLMKVYE